MESYEEKTIDEILSVIGPFNKYQWILLAMLSYCMMNVGLQALTMTFISKDPGWKCNLQSSSSCNFTTIVTPSMKEFGARCTIEKSEWMFPVGVTSIVTEFDLYCDKSIWSNFATSMVFLGWFIGAILFGYISDRCGRKKCLMLAMLTMSVPGTIASFSGIFWLFCLFKVLVGAGIGGSMMCIFILITEFVGLKKRAIAGIFIWNFLTVGVCLVAFLAYFIKDWKYLNLSTSLPGFLIIPMYYFMPESIRWLLVNGRDEEAENLLKHVADVNGFVYPPKYKLRKEERQKNENIVQLLRSRSLMLYTFMSILVWFSCSMVYYGVTLSSGNIGGNVYLVFFLTSIIAIPANFAATFSVNRFGRKKSLIASILITAISMIGAAMTPVGKLSYTVIRVTLSMIAKFHVGIAFNAAYLILFELLPTSLRNVGMGMASAAARIGSFISSYVVYLESINRILPFVVFGGFALLSAVVGVFFPETKNIPTKETIHTANKNKNTQEENERELAVRL